MENEFYTPHDTERFGATTLPAGDDHRNPFQIDRDRIVFSFAFRRLQSKTQVFQSGEYDFYRTRLTHSIEVAKLGRSICDTLRHEEKTGGNDGWVDSSLTEAICLAHDLGHPPFGHIGERKLNDLMSAYGGFEGNAQTVRILSELIYKRPDCPVGMSPTRALLDGVMKYKVLWREAIRGEEPGGRAYPEHHFLYQEQAPLRDFVLGPVAPADAPALNRWKSIECQIMDWADDTAYSLNDIADGIQAGYISLETLRRWRDTSKNLSPLESRTWEDLRQAMETESYERRLSHKIGRFVRAVRIVERHPPSIAGTRRHAYDLTIDPEIEKECRLYKRIACELIFQSPRIQQVEFKGSHILSQLFEALMHHYAGRASRPLGILPRSTAVLVQTEESEAGKARRICDYLAGLTDGEAIHLYRRLFDPEYGSIADLT